MIPRKHCTSVLFTPLDVRSLCSVACGIACLYELGSLFSTSQVSKVRCTARTKCQGKHLENMICGEGVWAVQSSIRDTY